MYDEPIILDLHHQSIDTLGYYLTRGHVYKAIRHSIKLNRQPFPIARSVGRDLDLKIRGFGFDSRACQPINLFVIWVRL